MMTVIVIIMIIVIIIIIIIITKTTITITIQPTHIQYIKVTLSHTSATTVLQPGYNYKLYGNASSSALTSAILPECARLCIPWSCSFPATSNHVPIPAAIFFNLCWIEKLHAVS